MADRKVIAVVVDPNAKARLRVIAVPARAPYKKSSKPVETKVGFLNHASRLVLLGERCVTRKV